MMWVSEELQFVNYFEILLRVLPESKLEALPLHVNTWDFKHNELR